MFNDKRITIDTLMKNADDVAVWYLYITFGIYAIMCILMGHPFWIVRVFLQNMTSDLTGETPRMLASTYYNAYMISLQSGTEDVGSFNNMYNALSSVLPEIIEFTCINTVVLKFIHKRNLITGLFTFLAGYVLQALIAISWSGPVTKEVFEAEMLNDLVSFYVVIFVIGLISYFLYNDFGVGNESFERMVDTAVSVPMSFVYLFFEELFKISAVIALFHTTIIYSSQLISMNQGITIFLSSISFLTPVYFVVINYFFDRASGVFSKWFVKISAAETSTGATAPAIVGELYCLIIAVSMMVSCFILYFRLS